MQTEVFNGPRLKVQRAHQHIADLNRSALAYCRTNPYKLVIDRHSKPGAHLLRVVRTKNPPEIWPLILGDAIHNLRSALDLVICDVMRMHQYGISSVHFPFSDGPESLGASIKSRTVHRARPDIVNALYNLRPYKGGNRLLHAIHRLDLSDKHRLLVPVTQVTGVRHLRVYRRDGTPFITSPKDSIIELHNEHGIILDWLASNEFKLDYDKKVPFRVLFGEGPVEGKPLIPTLAQMAKLVGEIVESFAEIMRSPISVIHL